MTDLRFITDEQLRNMIERDKKELDRCLEHQLCKSTLLLAGSIIEAILVDFFLAFPRSTSTPKQVLVANLATLIEWAHQDNLITSRTKELSTVIRNYRNLIHPGREYRLEEKVDIHTATVAASLVEIITQEIAENYAKRLGYTAEQTINKVRLDPSCASIFPHVIDTMAPVERIKLFRSIPGMHQTGEDVDAVVESFIKLHALLKDSIPQEIVITEAAQVYEYIRNRSRIETIFYLRFFANNLDTLENDQREAVITYLLSMLKDGNRDELLLCRKWKIYGQVGQFLNSEDGLKRLFEIAKERLYSFALKSEEDKAEDIFLSVVHSQILLPKMSTDKMAAIANMLRELSWPDKAFEWASYLEMPF